VSDPRATASRNTHSVGFTTRLVTISAITPDGTTAITVDRFGNEVRVPMLFQRAKGALPAPGEQWLIAQDITNSWSFAAIMTTSAAPFTNPVVSNGNTGNSSGQSSGTSGIPGSLIAPGSIGALQLASLAFGTNIIVDPQFTSEAFNQDRLADPALAGMWELTSPDAVASGTSICVLPLMPSNLVPLYLNPGEQYYLAVQVDLSAGSATAGIQFEFNNGSVLGPDSALSPGPNTVAQLVTIPSGVVSGYVRLVVSGLGSGATATFTSPTCYITAGPDQLQENSVTANALAANSVTAAAIAADAITAASIAAGAVTAAAIAAGAVTAASIAAGAVTAASIAAGAVTATAIQAGTVVAGIVDGTMIEGAQFVAYGSSGEILVYSGTPGSGDLIGSWSAASGSDGNGNPYPAGLAIGEASQPQIILVPVSGNAAEVQFTVPSLSLSNVPNLASGPSGTAGNLLLSGPALAASGDEDWVQIGLYSNNGSGSMSSCAFNTINTDGTPTTQGYYNADGWVFNSVQTLNLDMALPTGYSGDYPGSSSSTGEWTGTWSTGNELPFDENTGSSWATGERNYINNLVWVVNQMLAAMVNRKLFG
jgi:hypothetical protein